MRIFRNRSWHIHLRIFVEQKLQEPTRCLKKCILSILKPEMYGTVTFTQDMFLQGGEYLLSFGCTGYKDGDFTVFHRLYDACNITVISTQNTVGFYDMNSKVEIQYGEE